MGIETDILSAAESLVSAMATPTYSQDYNLITTIDEMLDPLALSDSQLPAVMVAFGYQAQVQQDFLDTPRIGRVNEMTPLIIRLVLFDDGSTTPTISTQIGNGVQDIKRAIGDNLRTNVTGVFRVQIGGWTRPLRQAFTDRDVIDIPIQVWHSWEQRAVVAATVSGLVAPTIVSSTISSSNRVNGNITFVWTNTAAATGGTNIYKNGTAEYSGYADTTWTDPNWHVDHVYHFGAVAGANEAATPILSFPYYPTTSPERNYYDPIWLIGPQQFGEFTLGAATPEMLAENEIRRVVEQERLGGGLLEDDLAYTVIGPLLDTHLVSSRMPLLHIEAQSSPYGFIDTHDGDITAMINLTVYDDADRAAADRIDSRVTVNRTLHNLRMIASGKNIDAVQNFNGRVNIYNTVIDPIRWPVEAVNIGNIIAYRGVLPIEIKFRWAWRD